MEIKTTPWHETRTLIPPRIEMLDDVGMIQYKGSFLKKESPRYATLKSRFIHYDANYVKYCLLKEFYQLLFEGTRQNFFSEGERNELAVLLVETVTDFTHYCRQHPSEENPRELFRAFCKTHLYRSAAGVN